VVTLAQPLLLLRWWLALPPSLERLARRARPTVDVPMDTGRQMMLSGIGAGFFPWMSVANILAAGQAAVVEVADLDPLDRASVLVRRIGAEPLTPAANDFVASIREQARLLGLLAPGGLPGEAAYRPIDAMARWRAIAARSAQ
jgi:DNA-binding transcriptional LysR family regulator